MPFDIFRGKDRVLADEFRGRCERVDMRFAAYVADGPSPVSVEVALKRLGERGQHGSLEPVEGIVYRCEREGRVDFLAKWVRPDKEDGKYLANLRGCDERWHWRPSDPIAPTTLSVEGGL